MATQPKAPDSNDESSDELDAVIGKIDACLPKIHEKAEQAKTGAAPSPTRGFSPAKIRQTRQEFQAMSADSLLSESREDIAMHDPDKCDDECAECGEKRADKKVVRKPIPLAMRILRRRRA